MNNDAKRKKVDAKGITSPTSSEDVVDLPVLPDDEQPYPQPTLSESLLQRINMLENRHDELEVRFDELEVRHDELADDHSILSFQHQIITRQFQDLEARFQTLEQNVMTDCVCGNVVIP